MFKHSYTKYTVSLYSSHLPYWHDACQCKTKFFAKQRYDRLKRNIDPSNTQVCLVKVTVYGKGSMIRTEELECFGAKIEDIEKVV